MAVSTTEGLRWGTPVNLGGSFTEDVAVAANADGRLLVIYQGGGNTMYASWQNQDLSWTKDRELVPNARLVGTPAALRGKDGRIYVFWRSQDNRLMRVQQNRINGDFGSPDAITTGVNSNPAPVLNANGRISVFYIGGERAIWETRQKSLSGTDFTTPVSLGGEAKGERLAAALAADGRISFVHIGRNDELWTNTQKADDATEWEGYAKITTGAKGGLHILPDCNGHLDVHYWGSNNESWWFGQVTGYGSFSTSTRSLGGTLNGIPRSVLAADGRQHVFARGSSDALLTAAQKDPGSLEYVPFGDITGGVHNNPVPALSRDGRVFVFYRGGEGALWYAFQERV
ncbi:hypothetical protein ABT381_17295 [Streptomyces sp. NPDC000151]|uniref:hypothetical protein n=1 Tax=Streptomyces sp. NPDC000151 TaxID=3154244 RepID=UPI0033279182